MHTGIMTCACEVVPSPATTSIILPRVFDLSARRTTISRCGVDTSAATGDCVYPKHQGKSPGPHSTMGAAGNGNGNERWGSLGHRSIHSHRYDLLAHGAMIKNQDSRKAVGDSSHLAHPPAPVDGFIWWCFLEGACTKAFVFFYYRGYRWPLPQQGRTTEIDANTARCCCPSQIALTFVVHVSGRVRNDHSRSARSFTKRLRAAPHLDIGGFRRLMA